MKDDLFPRSFDFDWEQARADYEAQIEANRNLRLEYENLNAMNLGYPDRAAYRRDRAYADALRFLDGLGW